MVNINIQIDGNKVTVNQSETPTKVEKKNKKYFIVMGDYDESSWVQHITEDFQDALDVISNLEAHPKPNHSYRLLVQVKPGKIVSCAGADWDIDN